MITIALIIGLYSYLIFFLGISSWLYPLTIYISVFILLIIFIIYVLYKKHVILNLIQDPRFSIKERIPGQARNDKKLVYFLFILLVAQIFINLIGVFGPEIGFDALWYHLTFPKLYLLHHSIYHIPGSLLYYSDMPKLGEMLYTAGLALGNETIPKLIHFSFGILTMCLLYSIIRKYTSSVSSLIGVILFYTSLVVGWESTSAYIDLIRTFYELMALSLFLQWRETKQQKLLLLSAVMIGFAITTKLLALGSLVLFILLIIYEGITSSQKYYRYNTILLYVCVSMLIPLPWLIFSYVHTSNPFYPFFTHLYNTSLSITLLNPLLFVTECVKLFLFAADPISPLYMMFLPLVIFSLYKNNSLIKIVACYCFMTLIVWYITPRTGGGRFILPYLPGFSILVGLSLEKFLKNISYKRIIILSIILTSCISIVYRGVANEKYISYILGKETKREFLKNHLNYSFGDFYDIDGYFAKNISRSNKDNVVLLYGFHNLYYVDFPFIDNSWIRKGDHFNYIATQNSSLPKRFSSWTKVYTNRITNVNVYTYAKKMETY